MSVENLPINPGDWGPLNDFLAVGHKPDGTVGGSVALRKGRQDVANELTSTLIASPPAQSYSVAGTSAATIGAVSQIANGALVAWTDPRFRYLGGTPEAYTSAGHGTDVASVLWTDQYAGIGASRLDRQWWVEFDFEGQKFEILEYAATLQRSNIYVDGQPVASELVTQDGGLTAGSLYLRLVDFGARGKHTVKIVFEAMLFGGIYFAKTDTLLPPTSGDSIAMLLVGDSYAASGINGPSNQTYRVNNNYAFRMARRLGVADLWCDGVGGTGVVNTQAGTVPIYGDRASRWPTTADVVVVQSSKNDSALITAGTLTAAALQTNTVTLLAAIRAKYPHAFVVVLGIVKPGNPNADETTANNATKAAVASMGERMTFVDAIAAGWFTGTGHVGATAGDGNADVCLSSDASHPTTEGHALLGDFVAAAVSAAVGAPMIEPETPSKGAHTFDIPGVAAHSAVNGTPTYTQNGAAFRGGYRMIALNADYVEWEIGPLQAGTWTFAVETLDASSGGITTFSIDGVDAGTKDTYAAATAPIRTEFTGLSVTAGVHKLRFRGNGKNVSSSGNGVRFSGVSGSRTGA